jgi:anti-sigma-K factor RskA
MTTINKEAPERQDIEALLPWHAAGTLSRRDADRVEQALASDRELARRYQMVREELNETIHLNETLGAPSARAMERLFAAIEAEAPRVKKASFDLFGKVVEFMSSFSPRALAMAGTAAAVAVLVQAAVLTTVVVRDGSGQSMELASASTSTAQLASIRFSPQASAAEVTRFLDLHKAKIVDGPKRNGVYDIQLATSRLPQDELSLRIQKMKAESRIVDFVASKD